jgi:hypothetical protein
MIGDGDRHSEWGNALRGVHIQKIGNLKTFIN